MLLKPQLPTSSASMPSPDPEGVMHPSGPGGRPWRSGGRVVHTAAPPWDGSGELPHCLHLRTLPWADIKPRTQAFHLPQGRPGHFKGLAA